MQRASAVEMDEAIAIIGMAGHFPGARNVDELWENLCNGVESVSFFTAEELQASGVEPAVLTDPTFVNAGALMDDADCFDASFFGFTPREAEVMDPQHRVFLECAWEALEHAGYDPEIYSEPIGVFGGVGPNTYFQQNLIARPELLESVGAYQTMIGNAAHFPTTRVSYKLNLKGPSINVQTACSTSGVAIHLACQSLLSGECDMALAGGVRIRVPLKGGYFYQADGIPSPDGHCRAFDAQAQGTVYGSGGAVIVLKRLSDALRDGDALYAVIRSSAMNNDGAMKVGFTAPSVQGQAAAIAEAYALAGISADSLSYIEAHGTGTALGDPIEIAALTKAFRETTDKKQFCAIGSLKTNIGHLDAGAGVASVIKTALALKHKVIPPSLHFHAPNPQIDFANSPFYVNTALTEWNANGAPRRAGVSSFGLGGTNVHLVLEEPPAPAPSDAARPWQLLVLSAKTPAALDAAGKNLAKYLQRHPDINLADVAYTCSVGRRPLHHRRIAVCRDVADAVQLLEKGDPQRVATQAREGQEQSVVFMFPGGGAQYVNMGRELYATEAVFREQVDECLTLLKAHAPADLHQVLFPSVDTAEAAAQRIEEPPIALPLLFTLEWAMSRLLMSWGIQPTAMIGHSMGEYTAACLAGVLSLADALALVALRGRLFATLPAGAMLSVAAPAETMRALMGKELAIAAINQPSSCVISGEAHAIEELEQRLSEKNIDSARVHIAVAAHSQMVEPILAEFRRFVESVALSAPAIPYVSNVTGAWISAAEATNPAYWVKHLRQTVRFSDGLHVLMQETEGALVEVGPGQTLSTFARQHPGKSAQQKVFSTFRHVREQTSDVAFLLKTMGKLWLTGVTVDWSAVYQNQRRQRVALPTYPFERKRYWIDPPQKTRSRTMTSNGQETLPGHAHENGKNHAGHVSTIEEQRVMSFPSLTSVTTATTATDGVRRKETIIGTLKEILEQLSGVAASELDAHATFLELGFDSLFLTRANVAFEKKFGVKITFRQLFRDCPTLDALATYIDGKLPPEPVAPAVLPPTSVPEPQPVVAAAPPALALPSQSPMAAASQPSAPEAPPTSTLERVITQQLRLMSEQLEILRGGRPGEMEAQPGTNGESYQPTAFVASAATPAPSPLATPNVTQLAPVAVGAEMRQAGPQTPANWKPPRRGGRSELTARQRQYLQTLIARYTSRTAESKRLIQLQRPRMADPIAVSGFNAHWKEMVYQIAIARAFGSRCVDVDGNEYVDLAMSFGVDFLGHSPTFVTQAVEEQIRQGIGLGMLSPLTRQVADTVCELTGMERATFLTTGSEANMAALRAARTVTGRDKFAVFAGAYHGVFDEVLIKAVRTNGQLRPEPVAPGIPGRAVADVLVFDYGDPHSLEALQQHGEQLAAVFVEPVQSRHPDLQPREFLHALREITRRTGAALIFDEMITGFRLHQQGAQGWYGVHADMASYGKLIGGGLPLSILAGKGVYMDAFDGGLWNYGDDSFPEAGVTFFAGTFAKHPLSLAAAAAVFAHLQQRGPRLQQELNERSSQFVNDLNKYFAEQRVAIWIEHCGSMLYFTFPDNNELARLLFYALREKGVHILDRPIFLSTAHTDEDLAFISRAVRESVIELKDAEILEEQPTVSVRSEANGVLVHRNGFTLDSVSSASVVAEASRVTGGETRTRSGHVDGPQVAPTTDAQLEVWHASQMGDDASCAFILSCSLHLHGPLQQTALRQALQQVVDRHDALHATFSPDGKQMRIAPFTLDLPISDYSGPDGDIRVAELLAHEVQLPFDLVAGPLVRAQLVRLAEQHHLLVLSFHHIICDGFSIGTAIHELGTYYSAAHRGSRAALPAPMQFSEYARWQDAEKTSSEYAAAEDYWVQLFTEPPPNLELPVDYPRPPVKTFTSAEQLETLEPALCADLRQLGARYGCTLFSTLLAGYVMLLHRLTGQGDIVISTPLAGQSVVGRSDLVGHCVNFHPLRFAVDGEQTCAEFLASVQEAVLDAYEHRNYTFGSLLKKLKLARDPSRSPLFSTQFNLDPETTGLDFSDLRVDVGFNRRSFYSLDLGVNVIEANGALTLRCDYNTDLFAASTIRRWLDNFRTLLQGMVATPEQPLAVLPFLTASERQRVVTEWNDTTLPYPHTQCLHELFEEQAARAPEAIAVVYSEDRVSYGELNRRADDLARRLQALGVGPEALVGLYVERSIDMVIGLLGILKAGGAYVPLDPSYPADRVTFMLTDAEVGVIVTQEHLVTQLPAHHATVVCVDQDEDEDPRLLSPHPHRTTTPENLAYMIYTSGSTGQPKGVQITHRSVVNFLTSMRRAPGMTARDVLLAVTTLSFDIAALEVFLPLVVGGKLEMVSREVAANGERLWRELETAGPTVMQATPVTWRMLIAAGWQGSAQLKILCGGEALSAELAAQLRARGAEVWNLYGPTETTIWSTVHRVDDTTGSIPIGRPIANTQVYILDRHGRPAPIGVTGELYIGGHGVARGYSKRPELTAEKFIPDPFRHEPGARLYRTGDLARYRADGSLECLGRIDHQIKLRGFRIELDEISAVLATHPEVHDSVVVVREDRPDDKRLVAYVVPRSATELTAGTLRAYARSKLPDYMVPATFVMIAALPRTPNGKINRRALPVPDAEQHDLEPTFVAPQTTTEQVLAAIWADVLDRRSIGVHDNFFELGGHSLLAAQLISRVRMSLAVDLPLRSLFEAPTVAGLATTVESLLWTMQEQAPVTLKGDRVEIDL